MSAKKNGKNRIRTYGIFIKYKSLVFYIEKTQHKSKWPFLGQNRERINVHYTPHSKNITWVIKRLLNFLLINSTSDSSKVTLLRLHYNQKKNPKNKKIFFETFKILIMWRAVCTKLNKNFTLIFLFKITIDSSFIKTNFSF